jgi:hypothetical protein
MDAQMPLLREFVFEPVADDHVTAGSIADVSAPCEYSNDYLSERGITNQLLVGTDAAKSKHRPNERGSHVMLFATRTVQ